MSKNYWVLEVLEDMITFSVKNNLPCLGLKLGEALIAFEREAGESQWRHMDAKTVLAPKKIVASATILPFRQYQ